MSKANEKKQNRYNADVVRTVAAKYGVTYRFVNQSLNGDRKSATSGSIVKEYKRITKEVEALLDNQ